MRRLVPSLILALPLSLGAQEAVTLDQSLQLDYQGINGSMGSTDFSSALTRANYRFNIGMPIVAYRLGSVNFGGVLGYLNARSDDASDHASGLNSMGVQGLLFPYQPYHISFSYLRSKAPSLFDSGGQTGQVFGLGLNYRGTAVQDLEVDYRHGTTSGFDGDGSWTSWTLVGSQRLEATDIHFGAERLEAAYGPENRWHSEGLSFSARTPLGALWTVDTNFYGNTSPGLKTLQGGTDLLGVAEGWTSVSSFNVMYNGFEAQAERSMALSQSLAHTWNRLTAFTQVALTGSNGSGAADASSLMESLTLGTAFRVTPEWILSADASKAWSRASGAEGADSNRAFTISAHTLSLHAGAAWGGSVPDVLKHALYYWSDLRYRNRIQEEYPPGYLPPELAESLLKRRMNQQGTLQFTGDVYHLENADSGRQDWVRIQGGLNFPHGLMLRTIGDWRENRGFTSPGVGTRDKDLSVYGAYGLGRTSLRFSLGYSRTSAFEDRSQGPSQPSSAFLGWTPPGANTFYSLGADSRVAGVPCGVTLLRNNNALGIGTTSLLTHVTVNFRSVVFNVGYQQDWRSDGLRVSQVTLNLVRWFDTIALWGFDN